MNSPVNLPSTPVAIVVRKTIRGHGWLAKLRRHSQVWRRRQESAFVARWSAHFFGHLEIAKQFAWAGREEQRYEIFALCRREVVCRLKIMERTILIDDKAVKMGAIAGLMTAPDWQKKGLACRLLTEAKPLIFKQLEARIAGLLCLPHLADFYNTQGWRRVDCPVLLTQNGTDELWPGLFMILSDSGEEWNPRNVHLCGLPF